MGSDETWHFARGNDLEIAILGEDGAFGVIRLGPETGRYVATVPADRPFAARIVSGTRFALVSCCVAPGFEFDEFELLDADALAIAYSASATAISSFLR